MSNEYIATVLKRLRVKSGLTANEVGELIGKSGKTVNGWENARSQPDAELLLKLCDIYKVDDIMSEFKELTNEVPSGNFILSTHEKTLVIAYRQQPEMQPAVDRVLGIGGYPQVLSMTAARTSTNEQSIKQEYIQDLSKYEPDKPDF